jgi:hypothetical protein
MIDDGSRRSRASLLSAANNDQAARGAAGCQAYRARPTVLSADNIGARDRMGQEAALIQSDEMRGAIE